MNKKTVIAAVIACGMISMATASKYDEAYKRGDLQFIATNTYLVSFAKTIQPKDYAAFSDAYLAAGRWTLAVKYANLAKDNARYITAMNAGLEKNFINPESGKYWVEFNDALYLPENVGLFKAIIDLAVECASNPAKAAKAPLGKLVARLPVWNKYHPDQPVSTEVSDSAIIAYAASDSFQWNIAFNLGRSTPELVERNNAMNKLVFDNANFKNDAQIYKFSGYADRMGARFQTTFRALALKRVKDCRIKSNLAVFFKDANTLLDALAAVKQDTFNAAELDAIIGVLNGQPNDWRSAELKAALKNINAMYTLKLYDDRDTWEPVLSKIRAMLDARD